MLSVYVYIYLGGGWGGWGWLLVFFLSVAFPHLSLLLGVNTHIRGVHVVCVCVYIYLGGGWRIEGDFWFSILCGFSSPSLTIGCKHSTRGVHGFHVCTHCLTIIYCFLCSTVPSHGVHDGSKPDGKESVYLYLLTWKWGKAFSYLFSTLVFALHG